MKIEGSVQEVVLFIELFFKKFAVKDKSTGLSSGDFPIHTMDNKPPSELGFNFDNKPSEELPPHKFPLLNPREYRDIYKEAQQEVPKED